VSDPTSSTYLPEGLPGPQPRWENVAAPYWEANLRGELVVQRCRGCGRFQWTPEWICHRCHSSELGFETVSPRGRIWSWERVWHPVHPALSATGPYLVVIVELPQADGVRMVGNLLGDPQQNVVIESSVQAVFEPHDGYALVHWQLIDSEV
jgi:uncharacterized OB-fold protein